MKKIYIAEDIDKAQIAIKAFELDHGAKYPKADEKIVNDMDVLLKFDKYPAEHWVHLCTTNPIESTFATVRLRTKGHQGSRIPDDERSMHGIWFALVHAGEVFYKGKLLERPTHITPEQAPEQEDSTGVEVA